jgi:hypothetical protein
MGRLFLLISQPWDFKVLPGSDGSEGSEGSERLAALDEDFGLYWVLRDDIEAFAETVEQRLRNAGQIEERPHLTPRPGPPKGVPPVPVA